MMLHGFPLNYKHYPCQHILDRSSAIDNPEHYAFPLAVVHFQVMNANGCLITPNIPSLYATATHKRCHSNRH